MYAKSHGTEYPYSNGRVVSSRMIQASISVRMGANTWTISSERWPSKLHHTHDYLHAVTADQFDLQGHPTTKMDRVDFQGYAQGETVKDSTS